MYARISSILLNQSTILFQLIIIQFNIVSIKLLNQLRSDSPET